MNDYALDNLTIDGFQEFTEKRKTSSTDPRIAIGKGGRISINKVAYKKYFKSYKFVKFYYNPNKKIIALELDNKATDNAYEIKESSVSKIASINSLGFFKHNKIDVSVKRETEFIGTGNSNRLIFIRIKEWYGIIAKYS